MLTVITIHSEIEVLNQINQTLNVLNSKIKIEKSFNDIESAFEYIKNNNVDLIISEFNSESSFNILDIKDLLGSFFISKLIIIEQDFKSESLIQAIRHQVFDVFKLPLVIRDINQAIDRLSKNKIKTKSTKNIKYKDINDELDNENLNQSLKINTHENQLFVNFNEIDFLSAKGAYTNVILINKNKLKVSKNLGVFLNSLSENKFIKRISRSYAINFNQIEKISKKNAKKCMIFFKSGNQLEVSRTIANKIGSMFNEA